MDKDLADIREVLMNLIEDIELSKLVEERRKEKAAAVAVSLDDL